VKIVTKLFLFLLYGYDYENKLLKLSKKIYNNNKEILIYKVKQKLLNINITEDLNLKKKNFSNFKNIFDIQKSYHQYLWSYFINTELFTSHLIYCLALNKNFFFPLPKFYINNISQIVKTNGYLSEVLWNFVLILSFFKNLILIIFSLVYFFKILFNKKIFILCNALNNSIPNKNKNLKLEDFYLWFYRKFNLNQNVTFLHSSRKISNTKYIDTEKNLFYLTKYNSNPDLILFDIFNLYDFLLSFFYSTLLIIKLIFKKQKSFSILFYELFKFNLHLKNKKSFKYVLYNNSNMVFRPLWTYAQEYKIKNSVFFYFYSINNDPLEHYISKKKYIDYSVFKILSWNSYILWGKHHLLWFKKINKENFNFSLVDFVPFEGQNIFLPKNKNKRLSIFDNTPRNDHTYYKYHSQYNIYKKDYVIKFLNDILTLTKGFKNIEVFLKIKRNNTTTDKNYTKYIEAQKKIHPNLKIFHFDTSAQSLILNSDLSISIPFASTAVIANSLKVKSVYYDPSNKLNSSVNVFKDIELINNKKALSKCLKKFLN
jgi:polysaccharide biosynthesis PFTS motif protein